MRQVKFKDEHEVTAVTQLPNTEDHRSESAEDVPDSFLAKREQNIKANKAMVTLHKHITTLKPQGDQNRSDHLNVYFRILLLPRCSRGCLKYSTQK